MPKLKILVINWQDINNPSGGGAEVHLHEIFSRIAKMGHRVDLFCCEVDGMPQRETVDGINIIRKGSRNLFNYYVPIWYKKYFSKENYDIIIDDINKIPFYTPLYVKEPVLAISHHFFGKSIFREAGFIPGSYVYISEKLIDLIYKKTPFAVVSRSTLNEFLDRGFSRKYFEIVQNAIHKDDFPMAVGDKYEAPTVSYFGRLKKYKSVDHLFHAFASIEKEIPGARLEILGKGDFRPYLEELTGRLGIERSTLFHGFVSEEDKKKLLSKAWCVVNTSMKEGWGITNIEANACGTPVISANVPGLKDSVKPGKSGLLYQYGNIEELAAQIKDVLLNKKLRHQLNDGAVKWASEFSWDDSAEKMLSLIESIISGRFPS
ncbi:MAG: glycosyltransferase family 4 protein [Candidatus Kapaibacterium sp.]